MYVQKEERGSKSTHYKSKNGLREERGMMSETKTSSSSQIEEGKGSMTGLGRDGLLYHQMGGRYRNRRGRQRRNSLLCGWTHTKRVASDYGSGKGQIGVMEEGKGVSGKGKGS